MHVFTADTDRQEIERAIEAGHPFWLDVPRDRFGADHPAARAVGLTEEWLTRLRMRAEHPMAFVEDDRAAVVFAGAERAASEVRPIVVWILATRDVLVTVHAEPCPALDLLKESPRDVDVLKVVDALTDSILEVGDQIEQQVDDSENRILQRRSRQSLAALTEMRQQVTDLLRIGREQRGMVERSQEELELIPVRWGTADGRLRDLRGHLARAVDVAESTRQTIAEALNLYLSIAAENLTRIATVLLPLTVVSGIFGMNFGWMVDHIDTFWAFVVFGVGGLMGAVLGVQLYLARKGYT